MELHPSTWPAEFVCPISRSVMADPVIVSSGHTYERRCIEAWLDLGQQNCLKENTPVERRMIPNINVRNAIATLARSRGIKVLPVVPSPYLARALVERVLSELEAKKLREEEAQELRSAVSETVAQDENEEDDESSEDDGGYSSRGDFNGSMQRMNLDKDARKAKGYVYSESIQGKHVKHNTDGYGSSREGVRYIKQGDDSYGRPGRFVRHGNDGYGSSERVVRHGNDGYGSSGEAIRHVQHNNERYENSMSAARHVKHGNDAYGSSGEFVKPVKHNNDDYGSSGEFVKPVKNSNDSYGTSGEFAKPVKNSDDGYGSSGEFVKHVKHSSDGYVNIDSEDTLRVVDAGYVHGSDSLESESVSAAVGYRRVEGCLTSPMVSHMHYHSISGADFAQSNKELPPNLATKPAAYYSPSESPSQSPARPPPNPTINILIQRLFDQKEQESAVSEIRQLTRASAESRNSLCTTEMVKAILPLFRSDVPDIQINAVAAIVNLSIEKQNKVVIVRSGAVPPLVDVLKNGVPEAQEHAAGAIFSLALADENKNPIGVLNAIPPLINLLHSGPTGARQDAAMALYHLSLTPTNKSKVVKLGAIPILLKLAESQDRPDLASRSLLILSNLASIPEGRSGLLELNGITRLVKLLAIQSNTKAADIPEQAAAVLLLLSKGNIRFKSLAVQAGGQELLTALIDCGSARAREKANALLTIMKESSSDGSDRSDESILSRQYLRRNLAKTEAMQMNSSAF